MKNSYVKAGIYRLPSHAVFQQNIEWFTKITNHFLPILFRRREHYDFRCSSNNNNNNF